MPRQIMVGPDGNVRAVDVGLHRVIESDAAGKGLRSIGVPQIRFNTPTAMACLSDGSFVVSEGSPNSRVVKSSAEGKPVTAWGTTGPRPIRCDVPHRVAVTPAAMGAMPMAS